MSPLRSDWSHAGLKGVIPSVLHYSLLGYNFFIPDAVGNDFFFLLFPPNAGFSAEISAAVARARGVREGCLHHPAWGCSMKAQSILFLVPNFLPC